MLRDLERRAEDDGVVVLVPRPRLFRSWYRDQRLLVFMERTERRQMDTALRRGRLPHGYRLRLHPAEPQLGLAATLRLRGPAVRIEGGSLASEWTVARGQRLERYQETCQPSDRPSSPCVEVFRSPAPRPASAEPPLSVPIRIREVDVAGESLVGSVAHRDHLSIRLFVTAANLRDVVAHFGVGFDPAAMAARLESQLRTRPDGSWMSLQRVLGGWVGRKAGRFPVDGDNEVCFGPARQFFGDVLYNGPLDRSTEAIIRVLSDNYRHVPEGDTPRFGDMLFSPGRHAGRFILTDPVSQRWIGFSVHSGGTSPYRFWWVDEDFSDDPFAGIPDSGFVDSLDVWRRDRPPTKAAG